MSRVQVFEPALCCATGVCGEDVDQALVTFSADLDFVRGKGGDVSRYNLASEPLAFAETEAVKGFLQVVGSKGLPLVLVDGVTAMTGGYPSRAQLSEWAGVTAPAAAGAVAAPAGATMLGLTGAVPAPASATMLGLKGVAPVSGGSGSGSSPETEGCCSKPASSEADSCCSKPASSEADSCCSKPASSETAGCC
jgi:arsenite-transporting ATPase